MIKARCSCGLTIDCPDDEAGATTRCVKCGSAVPIPMEPSEDLAARILAACKEEKAARVIGGQAQQRPAVSDPEPNWRNPNRRKDLEHTDSYTMTESALQAAIHYVDSEKTFVEPLVALRKKKSGYKWIVLGTTSLVLAAVAAALMVYVYKEREILVPYEIARTSRLRASGKLAIDIVVDESATQKDVLALAKNLRKKFADEYWIICIFDSHEAQKHRDDPDYPEGLLTKHWLIVIDSDGKDPIRWVARGRDH